MVDVVVVVVVDVVVVVALVVVVVFLVVVVVGAVEVAAPVASHALAAAKLVNAPTQAIEIVSLTLK